MRVVDAEDVDAVLDPELDDRASAPARAHRHVVALEVERVDVLVLLGRVLRVLDRAVGPVAEPLGVLADPRMIRRALKREVERDLEPQPRGFGEEVSKSSSVPRPGSTVMCRPPRRRSPTGCPGRSARRSGLFGPLRNVRPIGWMGGRYTTSKPRAAMRGSRRLGLAEGRAARRVGAGRPREHLVPRAEAARARGRQAPEDAARDASHGSDLPPRRPRRRGAGSSAACDAVRDGRVTAHERRPLERAKRRRRTATWPRGADPAPSSNSLTTSRPASTLAANPLRHVAK